MVELRRHREDAAGPQLPPRHALSDDVYDAVTELIVDLHIQPGARIGIDDLARQLNVSQTPVREALARLESEGLVTKEAWRGYTSAPLLDATAREQLYEIRLLLEPQAARLAAIRATDAQLAELGQILDRMRAKNPRGTYAGFRAFSGDDALFHHTVAAASGNRFLVDALGRLRAHVHLYRLYPLHDLTAATKALPEHAGAGGVEHGEILAALQAHDPDAADAAVRRHLDRSRSRLERLLKAADHAPTGQD